MAKAVSKKPKVEAKTSLIDDVAKKLTEFKEAESIALKVLKKKTLEDGQCKQVMSHALLHYTVVVMDGTNIIQEKYDDEDWNALLKMVKAQFSIE